MQNVMEWSYLEFQPFLVKVINLLFDLISGKVP